MSLWAEFKNEYPYSTENSTFKLDDVLQNIHQECHIHYLLVIYTILNPTADLIHKLDQVWNPYQGTGAKSQTLHLRQDPAWPHACNETAFG